MPRHVSFEGAVKAREVRPVCALRMVVGGDARGKDVIKGLKGARFIVSHMEVGGDAKV